MSEHEEKDQSRLERKIVNVGELDLRHLRTAEEFERIAMIENVGMILVHEEQMGHVAAIPMKNVGGIVPIPSEGNVRVLAGQLELDGEALAAMGDEDTILVLAGQLLLKSPVTDLKAKLVIMGQVIAPRGSESAIGAKLHHMSGQILYYKGTAPRILVGENTISGEFLNLVEQPVSLILVGNTRFTSDVTADALRQKVEDLILIGNVSAPARLHPVLQYLASQKVGTLVDSEKEAEDDGGGNRRDA